VCVRMRVCVCIFALLLITTPGLDCVCNAGSYFATTISCSGGCPCPSVSGDGSGEIISQTGPNYALNLDCKWIISSNQAISVQFYRLVTERNYDHVYVDYCTSSLCDTFTRAASLGGTYFYAPGYVSTTWHLRIHFISDKMIVEESFTLGWSVGGIESGLCALCVAGKYKIGPGNAVCTDCMSNQYSMEVGAVTNTCQACPANSVSPSASALCNCNAGWTGLNEGGQCVQCDAGKYKVQTGNSACVSCIAGKYSSGVNSE